MSTLGVEKKINRVDGVDKENFRVEISSLLDRLEASGVDTATGIIEKVSLLKDAIDLMGKTQETAVIAQQNNEIQNLQKDNTELVEQVQMLKDQLKNQKGGVTEQQNKALIFLGKVRSTISDVLGGNSKTVKENFDLKNRNTQLEEELANKNISFKVIAHDLVSTLSAVFGYLDLAENEFHSIDSDDLLNMIKGAHSQLKQHFSLLNSMLERARVNNGKVFNPTNTTIKQVEKNLEIGISGLIKDKNIKFSFHYPNNAEALIDEDIINIVLRNLMTNAIKFTETGKKIDITFIEDSNDYIFEIKDEGIGMTSEQIAGLLNGSGISTKGTNNEKGNGIGFELVLDSIKFHQGKLSIDSTKDGSVFTIKLPKKYKNISNQNTEE